MKSCKFKQTTKFNIEYTEFHRLEEAHLDSVQPLRLLSSNGGRNLQSVTAAAASADDLDVSVISASQPSSNPAMTTSGRDRLLEHF